MRQRDEGRDAGSEQVVAEFGVVVNPGLIDGVVAATLGDDARPGEGEAVGLGAEGLEEGNVLSRAVVRVAGDLSRSAVGNLAIDLGKGVPNGRPAPVFFNGTLNLVAENRAKARGLALQSLRWSQQG